MMLGRNKTDLGLHLGKVHDGFKIPCQSVPVHTESRLQINPPFWTLRTPALRS